MREKNSSKRPPLRLKEILCHSNRRSKDEELVISPPLMTDNFYSLVSPMDNYYYDKKPVLNSVPPRVSSMPRSVVPRPPPVEPQQQQQQQNDTKTPAKRPSRISRPCSRRHSVAASRSTLPADVPPPPPPPLPNTYEQKRRRRQSRAADAVAAMPMPHLVLQKSKSTPLRVKTYNVHPNREAELERQRKQRELEELIAGGRRGSTLKLTLTPRVLSS